MLPSSSEKMPNASRLRRTPGSVSVVVINPVLAVETLYFWAPNVKQRFRTTLPGALLTVSCWIGLSYSLGIYLRSFANFNKTYGAMGAAVTLMMWLYLTGFIMLVGAEINAELAKSRTTARLRRRPPSKVRCPPGVTHP
jgi:membrane protein